MAEAALYLISGEESRLEQFLEDNMESQKDQRRARWRVVETIGNLGPAGADFLHHLTNHEPWFIENSIREYCETLGNVGGAESQQVLSRLRNFKDWKTATYAMRALKTIESRSNGEN